MMMGAERYIRALGDKNTDLLEELAEDAGYGQRLSPLATPIMQARPPRFWGSVQNHEAESSFSPEIREAEMVEEAYNMAYFESRIVMHRFLHPVKGLIHRKLRAHVWTNSPRTDWRMRYGDFFTLLKATDRGICFVDCWEPNLEHYDGRGAGEVAFMKGVFKEKWYDKGLDVESNQVLSLAKLREHYPPFSKSEILFGPNWELALRRVVTDGLAFFTVNIPHLGSPNSEGLYAGAGVAALLEAGFYLGHYGEIGNGYFRHNGVELGRKAIQSTFREAGSSPS